MRLLLCSGLAYVDSVDSPPPWDKSDGGGDDKLFKDSWSKSNLADST